MVWFYHEGARRMGTGRSCQLFFQSHYGLILSLNLWCRNAAPSRLSIPLWSDFIEKATKCSRKQSEKELSIPLWSDFILQLSPKQTRSRAVNPFNPTMVWFYLVSVKSKHIIESELSIPLWSDFIFSLFLSSSVTWVSFQSHYGLILSQETPIKYTCSCSPFNPTMVWFYHH